MANLIFVSLPDEGSRMLLKRCILFFGFSDADTRVTENALSSYREAQAVGVGMTAINAKITEAPIIWSRDWYKTSLERMNN